MYAEYKVPCKSRMRTSKIRRKTRKLKKKKILRYFSKSNDEWENYPIDVWTETNGKVLSAMFEEVLKKCPNFYEFGIQTDFLDRQRILQTEGDAFFLGGTQETYK